MRVTVQNIKALRERMEELEGEYDILIQPLEGLTQLVLEGCLEPFGYWSEYHVPQNDKIRQVVDHLDAIFDLWHSIKKYVDQWYNYQYDSRDWWTNEQINKARNHFEPELDNLEKLLRELVELGGHSVDKPGN